ncbi:MAG: response regulator transcription factor [Nocardioides sp.]|nr:response regulator transcription factor [Nocardioides sp.]
MSRSIGRVRVALVEDHHLFAEALQIALEVEGYDVRRVQLHEAPRSVTTLLPAIIRTQASVVLLDLDLGTYGNGMRLVEPIVRSGAAVVVVTGSTDRTRWGEALANGARTVLPKSSPLNDILATIRRIHQGLAVMSREARGELMQAWHREQQRVQDARRRLETLTRREAEVLAHFMDGRQVREIAHIGVVSEATVRTQVKAILAKLDVSSQLAAVGVAHFAEWQPPPH